MPTIIGYDYKKPQLEKCPEKIAGAGSCFCKNNCKNNLLATEGEFHSVMVCRSDKGVSRG